MLRGKPYSEEREIFGEKVIIEALSGSAIRRFDELLGVYRGEKAATEDSKPNPRIPFAYAFRHTVKRMDGRPCYATDEEAADEDIRTWSALLQAWREVNGMADEGGPAKN